MSEFREAVVDLGAIAHNVRTIRERVGGLPVLAVVKANGYGHGALEVARAALEGGADWLGTADVTEAIALRDAGIDAPILCWLHAPDTDFRPAIGRGIEIAVSSLEQLERVASDREADGGERPARVQVKLETGLSRNGLAPGERPTLFARARELEIAGAVVVTGLLTHLSNTSVDDDLRAIVAFEEGIAFAREAGLTPRLLHAAATAAALRIPESRFTMVRVGIGLYGLSPFDDESSSELGLRPAMTLRGRVAAVRRADAGTGVSYNYTYRAGSETTLALVPLGYADGVPRHASNAASVWVNGKTYRIAGRIAMDQFVIDVGDDSVAVGDEVVLFGDPVAGVPSADDWARAASTINYEIVTRIGPRVPRSYLRPS